MFKAAQAKGIVKTSLHPAIFFMMISEGVFGFFEMMDCETQINKDCEEFIKDTNLLKKQVVEIFLTGALV